MAGYILREALLSNLVVSTTLQTILARTKGIIIHGTTGVHSGIKLAALDCIC